MVKGLLEIMHNYTKEYKDIEAMPDDLFVPFGNLYNIATEISNRFEQQVLPTPEIIRERILQRWDIQDLNKDQRNMLRGIVGTIDTFINKATLD